MVAANAASHPPRKARARRLRHAARAACGITAMAASVGESLTTSKSSSPGLIWRDEQQGGRGTDALEVGRLAAVACQRARA